VKNICKLWLGNTSFSYVPLNRLGREFAVKKTIEVFWLALEFPSIAEDSLYSVNNRKQIYLSLPQTLWTLL